MSLLSVKRREEVEKVIRSCLVAHQGDISIQELNRDYEEFEGEPIPYQEFQCGSLFAFLESLKNVLTLINKGDGRWWVRSISSEKSQHVSSLVEGQKRKRTNPKKLRCSIPQFAGGRPQVSINSRLMMKLIKEVNLYPDGVAIDWAVNYLNKISHSNNINRNLLERQLREVSHQVVVCGNNLYSTRRKTESTRSNITTPRYNHFSRNSSSNDIHCSSNRPEVMSERRQYVEPNNTSNYKKELPVRYTGEDEDADEPDNIFLPTGCAESNSPPTQIDRNRKPMDRFLNHFVKSQAKENCSTNNSDSLQNGYKEQQSNGKKYYPDVANSQEPTKESHNSYKDTNSRNLEDSSRNSQNVSYDNYESESHERVYEDSQRVPNTYCNGEKYDEDELNLDDDLLYDDYESSRSCLINDKIRERLSIIIQSHPEGIWCADLPQVYQEATGVSLNYMDIGFDSVREYASQLPEIFHCIRPTDAGDFKLFNAKKPPPDLLNLEKPTRLTLAAQYHIYDDNSEEPEVFPGIMDSSTTGKLIPEGVMEVGETVGHISVTELGKDHDYEEVEVSEVFTPSFFWVQLRKRLPKFKKFMNELHAFYELEKSKYSIPLIVLEKGLNVACIYAKSWHRGIIKTVFPDGRSHIHFYDYGTVKMYSPEDLYFLHRKFSYLPAQAIPCGLYNVKPYNSNKWDRSITWEFISKTSQPLIATIGSRDEEKNSLLISLTDTRGEEDFHINDWMYAEKYADQGHMVCTRNRNFAYVYYKECLERKGYDPNAIHNCDKISESDSNDKNKIFNKNSLINNKQKLKESQKDGVCENSTKIENRNLREQLNAFRSLHSKKSSVDSSPIPPQNPSPHNDNIFKSRTSRVYNDSMSRDYNFFKSDKDPENESQKSSQKNSSQEKNFNIKSDPVVESKSVDCKAVEHESSHMIKRTLALLAKYKEKQESDTSSSISPSKETSTSSGYRNSTEISKTSKSTTESERKIKMLKRLIMKQNIKIDDDASLPQLSTSVEKDAKQIHTPLPTPIMKQNLSVNKHLNCREQVHLDKKQDSGSEGRIENQFSKELISNPQTLNLNLENRFDNLPKLKTITGLKTPSSDSNSSDNYLTPARSPLFPKEKSEKTEISFFGSFKSECGGSGRMEDIDWGAIRTALQESDSQVSTPKPQKKESKVDISPQLPKRVVDLIKPEIMNIVESDENSTFYEKDVKFIPAGNIKTSRIGTSPLLKLKQRLHTNSYKSSSTLVSSKLVSILKGELNAVHEKYNDVSSSLENEKVLEVSLNSDSEVKMEAKEEENELKNLESQMSRRIRMYLEAQKMRNAHRETYSSSSSSEEEKKLEMEKDISGMLKGFVEKQIKITQQFDNKGSQSSSEKEQQSVSKTKRKINNSRGQRSTSSSSDSSKSSGNNIKIYETRACLDGDDNQQKAEVEVSKMVKVSSVLKNRIEDFTTLTNEFEKKEILTTISNLSDKESEEPELMKLVDQKKDQLLLNSLDYPPVKTSRSSFFERLKITNPSNSDIELDSDDLTSAEEENLLTNHKTILLPSTSLKQNQSRNSELDNETSLDQNSETKAKQQSSIKIPPQKLVKSRVNIETEEILLNPQTLSESISKSNLKIDRKEEVVDSKEVAKLPVISCPSYNDLEEINNDADLWEVVSCISDRSRVNDPVFQEFKNYKKSYNHMIENDELKPGDISTEDKSDTETFEDLKTSWGGIESSNFEYPDKKNLPNISTESISIQKSSNEGSVNGNSQTEFINFQYIPKMNPKKPAIETSGQTSSEKSSEKSMSQHSDDFLLDVTKISKPEEKWVPPGRAKSLKKLLLLAKQQ